MASQPPQEGAPKNKVGRPPRLNQKIVEAALRKNGGVQVLAARALGVHRSLLTRFVAKNQKIQFIINEVKEETGDIAQGHVIAAVQRGEPWALRYYLDNNGQALGYGIRKMAFRDEEGQLQIPAVLVAPARMSLEKWEAEFGMLGHPEPALPPAEPEE